MRSLRLVALGTLLAPAIASAENSSSPQGYEPPVVGWMESARPGAPSSLRQVLPASGVTSAGGGQTLILYINKNGVTLSPGTNDSRTNRSTLVGQTTAVPAWTVSATAWTQIMNCTRTMWAPFNVQVTDVDPGNVPHMESVVTTLSSTIGLDPNIGGVSPYTIGCEVIPNSVVFTFAQAFNGDPETICEVMGQEMAHSIGLDHQMLAADPMTYLQYNGLQAFRDQTVSCGEFQNRACGLQNECGPTQNSVQMLLARVGPGGTPGDALPSVAITAPSDGAQVRPGFNVTVDASDDGTVAKVELLIDGAVAGTRTSPPWSFSTTAALGTGAHTVETVVTDDGGQTSSAQIAVTVSPDAPPDTTPEPDGPDGTPDGQDAGDLVGGCAAGGGSAGGLGLLGVALLGLLRRRRR